MIDDGVSFGTMYKSATLANYGTIRDGVYVPAGTILNGPDGTTGALIEGPVRLDRGTVVNDGTIINNGQAAYDGHDIGLVLRSTGTISNQGPASLIQGLIGIYTQGARGGGATVINAGTIASESITGYAIVFGAGTNRLIVDPGATFIGTVSGSGSVNETIGSSVYPLGLANGTGSTTLELASGGSAGTLSGLGTKYAGFAGVTVDAGAQWTLAGTNTLAAGATLTDAGTLTNAGTFSGGVTLTAGGVLTNAAAGTISASRTGAVYGVTGAAVAVVNAGVISNSNTATSSYAIGLKGGGSITNLSGGTISGQSGVIALNGATATVVNAGSIAASVDAVLLEGGGSITNQSTGTITSGAQAIWISRANGFVDNLGYIGARYGIELFLGGTVVNGTASGTTSSAYIGGGIDFGGSRAGTLTNYGTIGNEVNLWIGAVVNGPSGATGALIESVYSGLVMTGTGTIINNGQIIGTGVGSYYGVRLGGGTLSNLGSASLIQGAIGVYVQGNGTVVNAGTIASNSITGTALAFGAGTNRLIVDPGATFTGTVSGSGPFNVTIGSNVYTSGTIRGIGTTTLELAAGSSAGTLSGLGTKYVGLRTGHGGCRGAVDFGGRQHACRRRHVNRRWDPDGRRYTDQCRNDRRSADAGAGPLAL